MERVLEPGMNNPIYADEFAQMPRANQIKWVTNATWYELADLVSDMERSNVECGVYNAQDLHGFIMDGTKGVMNMNREELVEEAEKLYNEPEDESEQEREDLDDG